MELKVWVDGVVRVVCGLSEETSCQDVVIALAQAIGECLQSSAGMSRCFPALRIWLKIWFESDDI